MISKETLNKYDSKNQIKCRILFLGYDHNQTVIIDKLVQENCEVWHSSEKIYSTEGFDLVISFGYKHIIPESVLKKADIPIINLHISFLPWNKGAHPNFWSHYERTPSGVSIHLIDNGIDTGPILFQRLVEFSPDEKTFSQTYSKLIKEIEKLFIDNIHSIIEKKYVEYPQTDVGTYHSVKDLPKDFSGWDSDIIQETERLYKSRFYFNND